MSFASMQKPMSLQATCLQRPQTVAMLRTRQPISRNIGQLQLLQPSTRRSKCLTVTRAEADAPSRPSRPQAPARPSGGGRGGYQGRGGGGRGGGGYQGRGPGGYQGRGSGAGGGAQGRGGGQQQQQGGRGYQGRGQGQGQGYQQRPPQGQGQGYQGQQQQQQPQQREFSAEPRTNAQQRAQRDDQRRQSNGPADGFVVNEEIRAEEVRLLGEQKEQLGVMSLDKALDLADEAGTDVVLISPDASPPVVRLIEVSKLKYEQEKAKKEASRKSRAARSDLKELKMRPSTDEHDYQVRLRSAIKFLAKGDKVKLTCQFRGREMEFQNIARDMFDRFVRDLEAAEGVPEVSVEARPRMQGKAMNMILGPVSKN